MAALPLYEPALLEPSVSVSAMLVASSLLAGVVPSILPALLSVCGASRRAMAVAIVFCFANLIGLGAGPVIAGKFSDHFATAYGPADGLRCAMMIMMCVCNERLFHAARCPLRARCVRMPKIESKFAR